MCGRFSLFAPQWLVEDRFDATVAYPYGRRYNAAPGQALPVITDERPDRIRAFRWGLVPRWADDRRDAHINARSETVAETPSFRDAFAGSGAAAGRCLVPADGYYEWDAQSQPHRIARTDGSLFAMAGLWTRWRPPATQTGLDEFGGQAPDGEPDALETFAIVTTEANEAVGEIHDRMPVVLPSAAERDWLAADPGAAAALLEPTPDSVLEAAPVSQAVNDPANDTPAVLADDAG